MTDDEHIALLREIRDMQQQQLANQAKMLANYESAARRQESQQQLLAKGRRWSRIFLALLVAGVFLYVLLPLFIALLTGRN